MATKLIPDSSEGVPIMASAVILPFSKMLHVRREETYSNLMPALEGVVVAIRTKDLREGARLERELTRATPTTQVCAWLTLVSLIIMSPEYGLIHWVPVHLKSLAKSACSEIEKVGADNDRRDVRMELWRKLGLLHGTAGAELSAIELISRGLDLTLYAGKNQRMLAQLFVEGAIEWQGDIEKQQFYVSFLVDNMCARIRSCAVQGDVTQRN